MNFNDAAVFGRYQSLSHTLWGCCRLFNEGELPTFQRFFYDPGLTFDRFFFANLLGKWQTIIRFITLVGAKIGITLVKGTPHLSACLGFWATQKQLPLVIVKKICLLDLGGASAAMGRQFHFRAHTRTYGAVSGLCSTSRVTQL